MSARLSLLASFALSAALVAGCGARTGISVDDDGSDPPPLLDGGMDGAVSPDAGRDGGIDGAFDAGCVPVPDECLASELCGDGSNDDCDDAVDEGCSCEVGSVQDCFLGPPGRRDVGACQDGSQVCTADGTWGPCVGGILPVEDEAICTGRDDFCDGCSDQRICPIDCPSPGDPRVPVGVPFAPYALAARDFYAGPLESVRWRVEGGPCDDLAPSLTSFELIGNRTETATFTPRLSGDYRVTLRVTVPTGEVLACSWIVHVAGPGLRVEMCYPESETQDLDLFLHRPDDGTDWYPPRTNAHNPLPEASCGWHNCEANVRQPSHPITGEPVTRADWGYEDTSIDRCENGPLGDEWRERGSCANPRLDIDNNLAEGTGLPENINVDNPRDGETFRIMVQNFTGTIARPLVNVYCGGRRIATFGQAPDEVSGFQGRDGNRSIGVMWRVADVRVRVDPATGETTDCDVIQLHPIGMMSGYRLTLEDPSY